jgi:hypothetical protein
MRYLVALMVLLGCWFYYRHQQQSRDDRKSGKPKTQTPSAPQRNTSGSTFSTMPNSPIPPSPRQSQVELTASDPTTAPEILAELGMSQRRSVRRLVASNPNTPVDRLIHLMAEFPYEVVENPMFTLLLLENPRLISDLEVSQLMGIIQRRTDLPQILLDQAIQHQSTVIHQVLLNQFQFSESDLELFLPCISDLITATALLNQKNCTDRLKLISAQSGNEYLQSILLEKCFSQVPELPMPLLITLIDHATHKIQVAMALHSGMTEVLLDQLLAPDRKKLHVRLAQCGDGHFQRLPQGKYGYGSLSESLQLRLAQNQLRDRTAQIWVRQELVEQPWVTPAVLTLLSRDPYERVRGAVAKLSDLSVEMQLLLAEDESNVVQNSLANNRSMTEETLITMSTHPNLRVRQLVARHLNTPIAVLKELAQEFVLQPLIIRHLSTPIALLRDLATSGQHDIVLTQTPKTPDDILQPILGKLAFDPNYTRRKLVARHPATTKALLLELAHDPEVKVSRIAQARLVGGMV